MEELACFWERPGPPTHSFTLYRPVPPVDSCRCCRILPLGDNSASGTNQLGSQTPVPLQRAGEAARSTPTRRLALTYLQKKRWNLLRGAYEAAMWDAWRAAQAQTARTSPAV